MSKENNKNNAKENEEQPNKESNSGEDLEAGQTMVALTYDEYEALENELEALRGEVEEQKDSRLRTMADFDNYKKRVQRDAARTQQDSMTSVLKVFLNAVDDIERALQNKPEVKEVQGWVEGIALIHQKIQNQMKNYGVERMEINPGEDFDPNIHEAISQEDHPDFEEGQIIDIVQPGYQISDRIIRPAMVRVAR
jgi:molecular chaperone GrpE